MSKRFYYSLAISLLLTVSIGCESQLDFTKVAGQENVVELCDLRKRHADGEGVEMDKAKAVENLSKAAEQWNAKAQFRLGVCYYDGKGVAKDLSKTAELFHQAAEQGYDEAQWILGLSYEYGKVVEKKHG